MACLTPPNKITMTKKLRLLSLIILTPLLLSACSGDDSGDSDDQSTVPAGKALYETSAFTLIVPENWEKIEEADFNSNVPDSAVVGFRNNEKNEVFTANLNVTHTFLGEDVASKDFAKSTVAKVKTSLVGFQENSTRDYLIPKGKNETIDTYMIEFEGKRNASAPIVRFRQIYAVDSKNAYAVTAAYLVTEDENVVNALSEMLDSFTLK